MTVSGIAVEVERKAIKHTHLSVFPPDARVHVSAPLDLSDADLRSFLVSKLSWIRKQIETVLAQPRQTRREYESGENVYLLGKRYRLLVRKGDETASVRVEGKNVVLAGRGLEARTAREARIAEWHREELKRALIRLVARCVAIANEDGEIVFGVRRMRNLWGSCNARKRRIWFNLALARVPIRCIEYVVTHELVHLVVPNHSHLFEQKMDQWLPRWREARKELNDFIALPLGEE
ncbi:MAG: M48 family metallopeptidase [Kiritimatiellae bacterium]|nr:M48 family metallopeptidase [Kiritimatiellia bacterium]